LSLNISAADLPSDRDSFIEVIEVSIEDVIDGGAIVNLFLPAGVRRMRRSLEGSDSLNLTVKITATRDCRISNCNLFAETLLGDIHQDLLTATIDGTLTTRLHTIAQGANVVILENAVIGSYQQVNETSKVTAIKDNGDGGYAKSVAFGISHWLGGLLIVVSILVV